MSRRWIRLDVGCWESEWVVGLPALGQLAWVRLLCYVKLSGKLGRAKALGPAAVDRLWGVPPAELAVMLEAAVKDGALKVDGGDWVVTGWEKYQEPDRTRAERQAAWRDRNKKDVTGGTPLPTVFPPSPVTRPPTTDLTATPSTPPRVKGETELREWLGKADGGALGRFIETHPLNAKAVDSILAVYTRSSMEGEKAWGKLPEVDRPAVLASALEGFAGEGKQYHAVLFRTFVESRAKPRGTDGRASGGRGGKGAAPSRGGKGPGPNERFWGRTGTDGTPAGGAPA